MPGSAKMRRLTPLWVHLIRVFLGMIFFSAGASKLVPDLPSFIGPVWLVQRLEPYGLGLFARFIALSELVVGVLLMSSRFATLGAIMLAPMITCILVVTISLGWQGTPSVNVFLLSLNAALLAYDYPKWRPILTPSNSIAETPRGSLTPQRSELVWVLCLSALLASSLLARNAGVLYLIALSAAIVAGLVLLDRRRNRAVEVPGLTQLARDEGPAIL